jgi:hypothetical protein
MKLNALSSKRDEKQAPLPLPLQHGLSASVSQRIYLNNTVNCFHES